MATGVQVWADTPVTNATADSNINWAEGMAPSQVNDSARAMMASVAKWRDDNNTTLITSGSTTALTLVTNQVESALTSGYTVGVTLGTAIDANATLAVDGLTAAPIQIIKGTNIAFGQYPAGASVQLTYSTTGTGQWIVTQTPPIITVGTPTSPAGGSFTPTPPVTWTTTPTKMLGLGATCIVAPKTTGRCSVGFAINLGNSGQNFNRLQIAFGPGGSASAPSSGAAVTGTNAGIVQTSVNGFASATQLYGMNPTAIVSGLTIGTTYWFDMSFSIGGGTMASSSCQFTFQEF